MLRQSVVELAKLPNSPGSITTRMVELLSKMYETWFAPREAAEPVALPRWTDEQLAGGRRLAEEIVVHYAYWFYDLSAIPVTYYRRERLLRRGLDHYFSTVFKEIQARALGAPGPAELITEEPIYYLEQKAREKSFPRERPASRRRPHLATMRMRFHADLARRLAIDSEPLDETGRVRLPYEL